MSNPIALVFAGVIMFILLFFGISASQTIIDNTNITANDTLSDNYNVTKSVSTQTFTVMAYIPYLLFVVALFGVLIMLARIA